MKKRKVKCANMKKKESGLFSVVGSIIEFVDVFDLLELIDFDFDIFDIFDLFD